MKKITIYILLLASTVIASCSKPDVDFEMSTAERKLINSANKAYNDSNYVDAITAYNRALNIDANNPLTLFNLATAQHAMTRSTASPAVPGQQAQPDSLTTLSLSIFDSLMKDTRFDSIAQKAAYNGGNAYFDSQALNEAIERYKQALRLNPEDNNARRNLRYTQLLLENQDNQNNQDNQDNQDKQDQKDQQDQQENKDNQDNKDQNHQNQDQQQQQQPQQPQQHQMSQDNIDQILKAMENAENRTRQKADQKEQQQQSQRKVLKPW
ncbi:MAG: tetratricopeptide repeat protein [Muribaculaceae bacterium]|nr:tetratricopeptide repeat protein [Muribaculaceae bacterium]MDE5969049.1 tetratricopeptide repeat protein [Muribaculaceae bacterium]